LRDIASGRWQFYTVQQSFADISPLDHVRVSTRRQIFYFLSVLVQYRAKKITATGKPVTVGFRTFFSRLPQPWYYRSAGHSKMVPEQLI
jgi:hypothetical protein